MVLASERSGLVERLDEGPVVCAEGYVFEFERRGLSAGGGVCAGGRAGAPGGGAPAAPRLRPRRLGRGRGADLLRASREAAGDRQGGGCSRRSTGRRSRSRRRWPTSGRAARGRRLEHERLRRGDASRAGVRAMFEEQVGWAVEAGVDFVIAETFSWGAGGADGAGGRSSRPACRRSSRWRSTRSRDFEGWSSGGVPAARGGGRGRRRA